MKVIGIDPGLASTGVGMVRGIKFRIEAFSYCDINTSKDLQIQNRLKIIYSKISTIIEEQVPDLIVVEDIFSISKFPKSSITLGKVCGVILLACGNSNIPVKEIQVREAKKVLTGNGSANKKQLERAVRHVLKYNNTIKPHHASDALALALIGFYRSIPMNNFN